MTDKEKNNRVNALAMTFLEELQMRPHLFADQILRAYKAGYHQSEKDSLLEEPVSKDLEEAMNRAADETRLAKAKNGQPFFSEVDFNLGFSNGAQWQKQQTVDKACEWLLGNWSHYVTFENGIIKCYNEMIRDLNKYLES